MSVTPMYSPCAVEADVAEVAEHDVEDRPVAVDREQGLRELRGLAAEPLAGAGRQDHADHAASSPSFSCSPAGGAPARGPRSQPAADSATKATPRTTAATNIPVRNSP